MKLKSFYKALNKVADQFEWRVTKNGLRGYRWGDQNHKCPHCPITAVYRAKKGKYVPTSDASDVSADLGLDGQVAWDIIYGADLPKIDRDSPYLLEKQHDRIYKALKRNVGLEPVKTSEFSTRTES